MRRSGMGERARADQLTRGAAIDRRGVSIARYFRQYLTAGVCDPQRVFELCAEAAVFGLDRPTVGQEHDLGSAEIYNSTCAMGWKDGPTAVRISVVPGAEMMIERYDQPSCESETWQSTGGPEPFTLDSNGDTKFVDISEP